MHTAFEADGAQGWTFLSLHAAPELVSGLTRDLAPSLFSRDDPCAVAFHALVGQLSSPAADACWRNLLEQLKTAARTSERAADATLTRWCARLGDVSVPERTVIALAEDFGLSRRTFERRFRDAFHLSPHRWRLIARVEAVKAALREGASVAAAARRAGYPDLRHFSRQFRQITGITARAYTVPFRSRATRQD